MTPTLQVALALVAVLVVASAYDTDVFPFDTDELVQISKGGVPEIESNTKDVAEYLKKLSEAQKTAESKLDVASKALEATNGKQAATAVLAEAAEAAEAKAHAEDKASSAAKETARVAASAAETEASKTEEALKIAEAQAVKDHADEVKFLESAKVARAKAEEDEAQIQKAKHMVDMAAAKLKMEQEELGKDQARCEAVAGVASADETAEQKQERLKKAAEEQAKVSGAEYTKAKEAHDADASKLRIAQAAEKDATAQAKEKDDETAKAEAEAKLANEAKIAAEKAHAEAFAEHKNTEEAASAGRAALLLLEENKNKLADLHKKATDTQHELEEAEKKVAAMSKLNDAEVKLMNELQLKSDNAATVASRTHDEAEKATKEAAAAEKAKDEAQAAVAASALKMSTDVTDLHKSQLALSKIDAQVGDDKKNSEDLSKQVTEASSITVPANTPVEEAHNILEAKSKAYKEATEKMRDLINKEKNDAEEKTKLAAIVVAAEQSMKTQDIRQNAVEAALVKATSDHGAALTAEANAKKAAEAANDEAAKSATELTAAKNTLTAIGEKQKAADAALEHAKAESNALEAAAMIQQVQTSEAVSTSKDAHGKITELTKPTTQK